MGDFPSRATREVYNNNRFCSELEGQLNTLCRPYYMSFNRCCSSKEQCINSKLLDHCAVCVHVAQSRKTSQTPGLKQRLRHVHLFGKPAAARQHGPANAHDDSDDSASDWQDNEADDASGSQFLACFGKNRFRVSHETAKEMASKCKLRPPPHP